MAEAGKHARSESDNGKCRNVCFTIFAEPEQWYTEFKEGDLPAAIKYLVYQLENCPETHRNHIQGYLELTGPRTYKSIKQILDRRSAHLEKRQGTAAQARAYCMKEESRVADYPPVERGTITEQGRRSDLEHAAAVIMADGESGFHRLAVEDPKVIVRHFKGLQQLNAILNKPRMRPRPSVYFLSGPPGCGKSRWAHNAYPDAYVAQDTKECWFDGYMGEDTVIFDEFVGNFPLTQMLKLMDYYPLRIPIKGGFVPIRAHNFVFTFNLTPEDCYQGTHHHAAWLRRVREFGTVLFEDDIRRENEATQEL